MLFKICFFQMLAEKQKESLFSIFLFPKKNITPTDSVIYTHRYIDSSFISYVFDSCII